MASNLPSEDTTPDEVEAIKLANERQLRRLSQLSRLGRRITSSLDLPTVLQEVVDAACELTGARYGALGVFDADGRIQRFITCGISSAEREHIGDLPQGLGVLGWLQRSQEPLRLGDLSHHPQSVGFPPHHPPMKTFLGVPIRLGNEALGNLYLTEKENGQEFTSEDEDLLILFADQAAIAIDNARLQQQILNQVSQLELYAREMELLHVVTNVAVATLDLEEVLTRALPAVLDGTTADAAEVWIMDTATETLSLKAHQSDAPAAFFKRHESSSARGW